MLPNFLVIGAAKSATTWFYQRLKLHPDIFLPETKEINFFNKYNPYVPKWDDRYEKLGITEYKKFFRKHKEEKAVGEVTPMYLYDPHAAIRINKILPEVKLICCLRNPIDRAYSHYWMVKALRQTNLSFDEVVNQKEELFVGFGLYYEQVRRYYNLFPREQIMILIYEEVFKNPEQALREVCSFLGVDPSFYNNQASLTERENSSAVYRSVLLYNLIRKSTRLMRRTKGMDVFLDGMKTVGLASWIKKINKKERQYLPIKEKNRRILREYFDSDIEQLKNLIGHNLDCWQ